MKYSFIIQIISFTFLYTFTFSQQPSTKSFEINPSEIHNLTDLSFDFYVNNGLNHTWFLIFYIKTCGHCHRARTEISKLFPTYKDKQSLLFGQIDSQDNSMLSIRFNITQVPYLIAIKNNKMLEMEKYPNEKNLKEFIEIISNSDTNNDSEHEWTAVPGKVSFLYVAKVMLMQALESLKYYLQRYVIKKGYNFKVEIWHLVTMGVGLLVILLVIETLIINCCCKNVGDVKRMKQKKKKQVKENEKQMEMEEHKEKEKEKTE